MAFGELGHQLVVDEARGPGLDAPSAGAAVADDVVSQFTVSGFLAAVALGQRGLPAAVTHDEFEMLDKAFDRAVNVLLVWLDHLAIGEAIDRSGGDAVDELLDDGDALLDLFYPNEIPRVGVAGIGHDDLELHGLSALTVPVIGKAQVGLILTDVAHNAAGAGHWAGARPSDGLFLGQHADVLRAIHKDAVAVQQAFKLAHRFGNFGADENLDHPLEGLVVGNVLHQPADAGPIRVEALAGDVIHQVVDLFTNVERVDKAGERVEVEPGGADAQQVVLDTGDFVHDGAEHLAAGRDIDAEELLDAVVPADVVSDRAEIVHPRRDGDVLVVVEGLAEFLEPAVQVADVRRDAGDPFTVELENESERGVGGGVLRSEVQDPAVAGIDMLFEIANLVAIDRDRVFGLDREGHSMLRREP